MKRTNFAFVIITAVALLATRQVWAAVKVESEEPAESTAETPVPAESKPVPGRNIGRVPDDRQQICHREPQQRPRFNRSQIGRTANLYA